MEGDILLNKDTVVNSIKSGIAFCVISILTKIMVSGVYIYRVFPEVMYLFWLLYISLGFMLKWQSRRGERILSVITPFLINTALFCYAYAMSGGFPNRIEEEMIRYWDMLHYLNLNILLAPMMMNEYAYYFRYLAMMFLPSVLLWAGMYLFKISKEKFEESINRMEFPKRKNGEYH